MSNLFQEFHLKDVVLRNRIAVSPMCQYSSDNGFPNEWHFVHLGSRAVGGAGLVMVEASAVSPEGRISPSDSGIYLDDHVEPLARIGRFMKQHGAVPGIQIAHAGRKASAKRPWEGGNHIETGNGGWDTIAPSAVPFGGILPKVPREMSVEDIRRIQEAFVAGARRALAAGFEWLELHFAHGYLAHEFYSPLANKRTDRYGGSFDNRIRFLLETFSAVRKVWPERFPLAVRLSVTDWIEGGVTVDESIELARRLKAAGLDLLDVSHGFITPDMSQVPSEPGFMIPAASRIRSVASLDALALSSTPAERIVESALETDSLSRGINFGDGPLDPNAPDSPPSSPDLCPILVEAAIYWLLESEGLHVFNASTGSLATTRVTAAEARRRLPDLLNGVA